MKRKPKFLEYYTTYPKFRETFDELRGTLLKLYTGDDFGYTDRPYFVIDNIVLIYPRKRDYLLLIKLRVDRKEIRERDKDQRKLYEIGKSPLDIKLKHNEKQKPRLHIKLHHKSEIPDVVKIISHYLNNFKKIQ